MVGNKASFAEQIDTLTSGVTYGQLGKLQQVRFHFGVANILACFGSGLWLYAPER